MSSLAVSGPGGGSEGQTVSGSGSTLKPYLRRKKSSLGETKVAVLGMSGVGKSALAVRFLTKRFIGEYDQSAENKYKCTTIIEGESVAFELLDTRSTLSPQTQKEDHGAREDVLRWADGFMLVYSVTSRPSFQILPDLRRKVEEAKQQKGGGGGGGGSGSHAQHVPVIVVANKADLAHYREVTQDEGARLAVELGCSFMEVSASEDMPRVMEAFHTLCREIIDYKRRTRTFLDRVFGLKKS